MVKNNKRGDEEENNHKITFWFISINCAIVECHWIENEHKMAKATHHNHTQTKVLDMGVVLEKNVEIFQLITAKFCRVNTPKMLSLLKI